MPTIDEIYDGYFNYLATEAIEAILNADKYTCKDFQILKALLLVDLNKILDSRQNFEERIKILQKYDKR